MNETESKKRVVLPLLQKVRVANWLDRNKERVPKMTAEEAMGFLKEEEGVDMVGVGMSPDYCRTMLRSILKEMGVEQSFKHAAPGRKTASSLDVIELQEGIRCIAQVLTVVVKELGLHTTLNGHYDRLYAISRRGVEETTNDH